MAPTQTTPASHRGPRRPRRTGRLVVGIAIGAVLIAGGTATAIAAIHSGKTSATTSVDTPKPQETGTTTAAATSSSTSASPTPTSASTPRPSPTPTPSPVDSARAAVAACRTTITAAETAVAAARSGASHWAVHTQARTDFLAHKITLAQTNAEFKRTRLAGPSDQKTFTDALAVYRKVAGGCDDLPTSPAATICSAKADALRTSVDAGEAVMKDWASHLNNMALHADHEMSATQARDKWIEAWTNAPPHLNAFSAADSASTKAPSCSAG